MGRATPRFAETVIETLGITSRYNQVANRMMDVAVAVAFTSVAGYALGRWELLLPGVLAGFLASVDAGRKHDEAKALTQADTNPSSSLG